MADRTYTGAGNVGGLIDVQAQVMYGVLNGKSQAPTITFNQGGHHG